MQFDDPIITAFAALMGSLVGGGSSMAATWIGQRLQARWNRLGKELEENEKLYGTFAEEAVMLFVDATQRSKVDSAKLMQLYAKVARIRLVSSGEVLKTAEDVARRLLEIYEQPPNDPAEIISRFAHGDRNLDPLRDFSEACRRERDAALKKV